MHWSNQSKDNQALTYTFILLKDMELITHIYIYIYKGDMEQSKAQSHGIGQQNRGKQEDVRINTLGITHAHGSNQRGIRPDSTVGQHKDRVQHQRHNHIHIGAIKGKFGRLSRTGGQQEERDQHQRHNQMYIRAIKEVIG